MPTSNTSRGNRIEFKRALGVEWKVNVEEGIIEGYGATWDRDLGGDRIVKGAFADVIRDEFPANRIKIYREHDSAIGLPDELKEDNRGLFVRARVVPGDSKDGDETLNLASRKVYDAFSIGWIPDRKETRVAVENGERTRVIGRVASLPHIGVLADPMNPAALVTSVKGYDSKEVIERLTALEAKLSEPPPKAERKSLWELAEALEHMAALESIRRYGEIDADEAEMARELIAHLEEITEEVKRLLPQPSTEALPAGLASLLGRMTDYANDLRKN